MVLKRIPGVQKGIWVLLKRSRHDQEGKDKGFQKVLRHQGGNGGCFAKVLRQLGERCGRGRKVYRRPGGHEFFQRCVLMRKTRKQDQVWKKSPGDQEGCGVFDPATSLQTSGQVRGVENNPEGREDFRKDDDITKNV